MKRFLLLLMILLMILTNGKRKSVSEYIIKVRSESGLKATNKSRLFCCNIGLKNQKIGYCMHIIKNKVELEEKIEKETDKLLDLIEIKGNEEKASNGTQTMDSSCHLIWVIDQPAMAEVGHYETIHHEAIYKKEYDYREYLEYVFYRSDESKIVVQDYNHDFDAGRYLMENTEFYRYSYSTQYEEIEKEVLLQPEYDEIVWIVEIEEVEEKGHFEEKCE